MALLELSDVHAYYGNIHALKGVSLTADEGEIVTLIGANGAGKSTTLKTISGLLRPRSGTIRFAGERVDGRRPHEIVALGICQAPEGRRIFPRMTVQENLEMGAFQRKPGPELNADFERVFTLFPRLKERRSQKAGTLSGQFYLYALGYFVTAVLMALLQRAGPGWNVGHLLFGVMSAASFFFPGLRYYRQRRRGLATAAD